MLMEDSTREEIDLLLLTRKLYTSVQNVLSLRQADSALSDFLTSARAGAKFLKDPTDRAYENMNRDLNAHSNLIIWYNAAVSDGKVKATGLPELTERMLTALSDPDRTKAQCAEIFKFVGFIHENPTLPAEFESAKKVLARCS